MASILGIQPFVFGVPVPSGKRSKNHIPPIFKESREKSSTRLKSSNQGEGYVSSLESDLSDVGLFLPSYSKQNMFALNGILPLLKEVKISRATWYCIWP